MGSKGAKCDNLFYSTIINALEVVVNLALTMLRGKVSQVLYKPLCSYMH
jgi:hypothetical protein